MSKAEPLSFLRDPHYRALEKHYLAHPIVLYTGAGASWADQEGYGLRGWEEFVQRILEAHPGVSTDDLEKFKRNARRNWQDKPWNMAEWVAGRMGSKEAFRAAVTRIVQNERNFQPGYKLLSGGFLKCAHTLRSTAAFCAEITAGRWQHHPRGGVTAYYQVGPNRRIQAVVTSNYDPFLEAAAAALFRTMLLKPVGAFGSSVGKLRQLPVFHIHGYVPFPESATTTIRRKVAYEAMVDLVVTRSDYARAWRSDDVYNFTMGPQIHFLRHACVLFIGFSFRDRWVNQLLEALNQERARREDRLYHYALMSRNEIQRRGTAFFEKLGVRPIGVDARFRELPLVLENLYQKALFHDTKIHSIKLPYLEPKSGKEAGETVFLPVEGYFKELCACRIGMVRHPKTFANYTARGGAA